MNEQSKATERRLKSLDTRYGHRWLVGRCLDVGCGPDPLSTDAWGKLTEVVPYDLIFGNKDATYLSEIPNASFDVVHSSHCLEHLSNPRGALTNWLRVLKPGGFILCTVPEEYMYEQGLWPSRFNGDHKVSWTMRSLPVIPTSINLINLLWKLPVDVEHVSLITQDWDPAKLGTDQTLGGVECAIEFVVRKPLVDRSW